MSPPRVVLASASPRRLELLRQAGLEPRVLPAGLSEKTLPGESVPRHLTRLAESKGRKAAASLGEDAGPSVVLAADTGVVLEGELLGKPADQEHACEMLRRLSGKTHEVLTSVFLLRTDTGDSTGMLEATRVRFRAYPEALIRWYVETGEPMDKAGAYAIQGWGFVLAERIEGSWTNVVGLPMESLHHLFREIGLSFR